MFDTVKQVFRFVFSDQIRLRRSKHEGIRIALAPAGSVEVTDSMLQRQEKQRQAAALLQAMQDELHAVLQSSRSLREHSRHLVALDAALRTQGLVLLQAMPLPQLTRALFEFEQAVTNWSPVGLATLRSKIAVAIAERRRAGESDALPAAPPTPPVAPAAADSRPEVTVVEVPAEALAGAPDASEALLAAYAGLADTAAPGQR